MEPDSLNMYLASGLSKGWIPAAVGLGLIFVDKLSKHFRQSINDR